MSFVTKEKDSSGNKISDSKESEVIIDTTKGTLGLTGDTFILSYQT